MNSTASTTDAPPEPAAAPTAEPRLGPRPRRILFAVLAVVLVVLTMLAGWMAWTLHDDTARHDAGLDAAASARNLVPALLNYNFATIDGDLARIDASATGDFQQQNRLLNGILKPAVQQNEATSEATVSSSGVLNVASPEEVTALVYFVQKTTTNQLPGPRVDSRSARITLDKIDGQWKVASFDTV